MNIMYQITIIKHAKHMHMHKIKIKIMKSAKAKRTCTFPITNTTISLPLFALLPRRRWEGKRAGYQAATSSSHQIP